MKEIFSRFALGASNFAASAWAFFAAGLCVLVWAMFGPVADFSDTWLLMINTLTTIVTFLMVFLIQNSQERNTKALHLKLDELLKGVEGARTNMVRLESSTEAELEELGEEFEQLKEDAGVETRAN